MANRNQPKVRTIPSLPLSSKVTFTVTLKGEMDWNQYFAGKYNPGDGGLFDPVFEYMSKPTFKEALQAFLARGLFDACDSRISNPYTTFQITEAVIPDGVAEIYSAAKAENNEQAKIDAQNELEQLEAEEKRLQERKRQLKLKAGQAK